MGLVEAQLMLSDGDEPEMVITSVTHHRFKFRCRNWTADVDANCAEEAVKILASFIPAINSSDQGLDLMNEGVELYSEILPITMTLYFEDLEAKLLRDLENAMTYIESVTPLRHDGPCDLSLLCCDAIAISSPTHCYGCGDSITMKDDLWCIKCKIQQYLNNTRCSKCGAWPGHYSDGDKCPTK